MGRPGQQSLNLWVPKEVHASIKRTAMHHGLTIKEYLIRLHEADLEASEDQSSFPNILEGRLQQIERQIKQINQSKRKPTSQPGKSKDKKDTQERLSDVKGKNRKSDSEKRKEVRVDDVTSIIMELEEIDNTPTAAGVSISEQGITLPPKLDNYLVELKRLNTRARVQYYRQILAAILLGYHERKEIEKYRGLTFYGGKPKNCEKPLKNLVELGLVEIRYQNPSKPNQKYYFVVKEFRE